MFKPFPDLILRAIEGFHIEEIIFIDPPALEPALSLKAQGYKAYSIHTDGLYYRLFQSFIGGNYRKVNWRPLMDLLTPLTRAKSSAEEYAALKALSRAAYRDLEAPEQGVALWITDRLLLWMQEQRNTPAEFPRITVNLLEDLIRSGESFLSDSKLPHLSLILTCESDLSYIPGDAAIAFSGQIETFKYVRKAVEADRLARFGKRLDYRGLESHFPHVPVWLILGFGSPEILRSVTHWMENRRKRVQTTPIYQEEDGTTHFLVLGWN